eukprot:CAMPEP_0172628544 /NCGR_PEP_ID=MMETSP1068-20121228/162479_1 /TAXON_ID=35684 /ORGANISM="Pseudopedinella elastica, Strain CCMP716" /LENGTH=60 /DNA_ID=CAMNT_0013438793 /DNA_START=71 /DNA_END=250 /DNA_ORIENTATION=+
MGDNNASFIPSSTFIGAKEGYVFTSASEGTGYYVDDGLSRPSPPPAAPSASAGSAEQPTH